MKPIRLRDLHIILNQNRPSLSFSTPNDIVEIKLKDAEKLLESLTSLVEDLRNRKKLPIPAPFVLDGKEFAEGFECNGDEDPNLFSCVGAIGGQEIYLRDLVNLNTWISEVLDAHHKMGCNNLKHIHAGLKFEQDEGYNTGTNSDKR